MPVHDMVITLSDPDENGDMTGSISSNLIDTGAVGEEKLDGAMHGIESLVLAHACVGMDVETPEYLQGLETAIDGAINNLG
jgi:hypothetical protein